MTSMPPNSAAVFSTGIHLALTTPFVFNTLPIQHYMQPTLLLQNVTSKHLSCCCLLCHTRIFSQPPFYCSPSTPAPPVSALHSNQYCQLKHTLTLFFPQLLISYCASNMWAWPTKGPGGNLCLESPPLHAHPAWWAPPQSSELSSPQGDSLPWHQAHAGLDSSTTPPNTVSLAHINLTAALILHFWFRGHYLCPSLLLR
jgi:hypothetical protein